MEGYVKVSFDLEDGPFGSEGIWCKDRRDLGEGLCEVANVPWFAYDVSLGDVVRVERDGDGLLVFSGVEIRGGHATLRVLFDESVHEERQREILASLPGSDTSTASATENIGYERGMGGLYALDLPPRTARGLRHYREVLAHLDRHEREGSLSYEEGDRGLVPEV